MASSRKPNERWISEAEFLKCNRLIACCKHLRKKYDPAVKSPGTTCNYCRQVDIVGVVWTCAACSDCDMCTNCFLSGAHELDHMFWRCDTPGNKRHLVFPRVTSLLFGGTLDGRQDVDSGKTGEIHGVTCNGCRRGIVGTRWKCAVCSHHDICSKCYGMHVHSSSHAFLRINAPGSRGILVPPSSGASGSQQRAGDYVQEKIVPEDRQQNDTAVRSLGTACNFCRQLDIVGAIWTCAACSDCDLCTNCFLSGAHELDHMFWRCDTSGSKRHLVFPRITSLLFGGTLDGRQEDADSGKTGEIHGVTCNGCRRGIVGTRWKCAVCSNYDICSKCYGTHVHSFNHVFLRINAPGSRGILVPPIGGASGSQQRAGHSVQEKIVPEDRQQNDTAVKFAGTACNSCDESSVQDALWKCEDCSDYNLCTTCYLTGVHDHDHIFSRLDAPRKERYQIVPRISSVIYGGTLNGHERTFNECTIHKIPCKGCRHHRIVGARWKCAVCFDYDLCCKCFRDNVHNLDHIFLRFDEPGSPGVHVVPLGVYGRERTTGACSEDNDVCAPLKPDAQKPRKRPDGNRSVTEELTTKLQELEETIQCVICMEARRNVAFLCGHSACSDCAKELSVCHICRERIRKKITLY